MNVWKSIQGCIKLSILVYLCIVLFLAICGVPCENGGTCSKPDTCSCADGWEGLTCNIRKFHTSNQT